MSGDALRARLLQLQDGMRSAWNRRVECDYRLWMSDGVDNDAAMWAAGERDFEQLIAGLPLDTSRTWHAMELGCGVGRLLRPAAKRFRSVVGVDISPSAVERAREFLAALPEVQIILGNGSDLSFANDQSVDFFFSFAMLSNVPVQVLCSYLLEANRVLCPKGQLRVQLYLGKMQQTVEDDTLAVRCYEQQRLEQALEALGFAVESVRELKMPFDAIDSVRGIAPYIVAATKVAPATLDREQLVTCVHPQAEQTATEQWPGSELEYRISLARAEKLILAGKLEEATQLLESAVKNYGAPEPAALAVLAELQKKTDTQ